MATDHALRRQLERARHLMAQRSDLPEQDGTVTPLPSAVARVRRRNLDQRLPEPTGPTMSTVGKLTAGRVKLPGPLRSALGWTPDTALVVSVHGVQLLVARDDSARQLTGASARVDATGRLALTSGQRQLLGVDADGAVLLSADLNAGVVRVVDPARVHALLAEVTPLADPAADGAVTADQPDRGPLQLAALNGERL